jgi:AraC-like DNA-binding protein
MLDALAVTAFERGQTTESVLQRVRGSFHLLSHGEPYRLMSRGQKSVEIRPGGLVLLPDCDRVVLCESQSGIAPLGGFIGSHVSPDSSGLVSVCHSTRKLIQGEFEVDGLALHPGLRGLPDFIYLPPTCNGPLAWVSLVHKQILRELRYRGPGHNFLMSKLFQLVFLESVRYWIFNQGKYTCAWVRAMLDPEFSPTLLAIHRNPGFPWSVASLAIEADLSRSQFAKRFHEILGVTPMAYVTECRLWRSYQMLRDTDSSVSQVARSVGFSCETALTRAFRRAYGCSPTSLRHQPRGCSSSRRTG